MLQKPAHRRAVVAFRGRNDYGGVPVSSVGLQQTAHKIKIAKAVNVTIISLDGGPKGYKDFDKGTAKKFVIDPHKSIAA